MICPKCKAEAGEAKFCPECGEKIYNSDQTSNENSSNHDLQNQPYRINNIATSQTVKSSPLKSKKAVIIFSTVVGFVLIAFVIFLIMGNKSMNSNKLIGTWENKNNSEALLTFSKNGTGKLVGFSNSEFDIDSVSFNWTLEKDNLLLTIDLFLFEKEVPFKAERNGDSLILTSKDDSFGEVGVKTIFVKSTNTVSKNTASETLENISQEKTNENTEITKQVKKISDKDFSSKTYLYDNGWGTTYYFIVLKNNSDQAVSVDINGLAKDSNGKAIGADDESIDIIGPGEETIVYLYFDNVENISTVDCSFSYNEKPYCSPCIGDLEVKKSINKSNVVISITNNGDKAAEFVEAYALFFDENNNIVDFDSAYVTDSDSEIKPSATLTKQLDSYEDFSTVSVYLTGRAQ